MEVRGGAVAAHALESLLDGLLAPFAQSAACARTALAPCFRFSLVRMCMWHDLHDDLKYCIVPSPNSPVVESSHE